jgi:Protein of unknown function (DUF3047)
MPGVVTEVVLATAVAVVAAAAPAPLPPLPSLPPLHLPPLMPPLVMPATPALVTAMAHASAETGPTSTGWRVLTLPRQTKPITQFSAEVVDGRPALRVEATKSYGHLMHEMHNAVPHGRLSWSWRLQLPNAHTDLRHRAGDDVAAKVCASFDMPLEQVPFLEREFLRMVRASVSEPVPAATLCWVWGGKEKHEELLPSPFSKRLRYIVLRNVGDPTAAWVEESRDVVADFKRAFGDEALQVPPLIGVSVGADADNTAGHSIAHVSGLRFLP